MKFRLDLATPGLRCAWHDGPGRQQGPLLGLRGSRHWGRPVPGEGPIALLMRLPAQISQGHFPARGAGEHVAHQGEVPPFPTLVILAFQFVVEVVDSPRRLRQIPLEMVPADAVADTQGPPQKCVCPFSPVHGYLDDNIKNATQVAVLQELEVLVNYRIMVPRHFRGLGYRSVPVTQNSGSGQRVLADDPKHLTFCRLGFFPSFPLHDLEPHATGRPIV